jgi:hypothetical protein
VPSPDIICRCIDHELRSSANNQRKKSRTWMMTTSRAKGVPIEAIQRVPLFADSNKHEVQEIARLLRLS